MTSSVVYNSNNDVTSRSSVFAERLHGDYVVDENVTPIDYRMCLHFSPECFRITKTYLLILFAP